MTRSAFLLMILAGLSFGALGCGPSKAGRQTVHKASGKITFAGGPVAGASVIFAPKNKQPVATSRTNDAGEFTLTTYDAGDGAAAGQFVVLVLKEDATQEATDNAVGGHDPSAPSRVDGAKMHAAQQSKKESGSGSGIPGKYGRVAESPLTAEVKEGGENKFSFDLLP